MCVGVQSIKRKQAGSGEKRRYKEQNAPGLSAIDINTCLTSMEARRLWFECLLNPINVHLLLTSVLPSSVHSQFPLVIRQLFLVN